jgi:hypothetical protein
VVRYHCCTTGGALSWMVVEWQLLTRLLLLVTVWVVAFLM